MSKELQEKIWSVKQRKLIEIKADPTDIRNDEEIATCLNINPCTIYRWQSLEGFWDEVYDLARRTLKSRLPKILKAMADKAINRKDVNAAKLCLEACGMVNSKVQVDVNHSGKVEHSHYDYSDYTAEQIREEAQKVALKLEVIANAGNGTNGRDGRTQPSGNGDQPSASSSRAS